MAQSLVKGDPWGSLGRRKELDQDTLELLELGGDPREEPKEANQDVGGTRRHALGHRDQRGHVPSAIHILEEGYVVDGGLGPILDRKNQNLGQSRKR